MKKNYLKLSLFLTLFSMSISFAQVCPNTAFTTGITIYTVYPAGTSNCEDRPTVLTVGASTFNQTICEDGYSLYELSSGSPVTPTDPFTIDTGFDTSCTYVGGALGIKEIGIINKAAFKLFPNPLSISSQDNLNLKFAINTSALITLYDITGKIVLQDNMSNSDTMRINVSNFVNGVYMMKIVTKTFSLSRKVILVK